MEVTETSKWSAPLNYTDPKVGLVVLLFKAAFILPVVSFVKDHLAWRDERRGLKRRNQPGTLPIQAHSATTAVAAS